MITHIIMFSLRNKKNITMYVYSPFWSAAMLWVLIKNNSVGHFNECPWNTFSCKNKKNEPVHNIAYNKS